MLALSRQRKTDTFLLSETLRERVQQSPVKEPVQSWGLPHERLALETLPRALLHRKSLIDES
ncbi:hypothetical protein [Nostoc sp.]|uniref:hypothetical protein n=1 Tax=Nostoc sp. TaxID=1180 RepID=UPI002FF74B6D